MYEMMYVHHYGYSSQISLHLLESLGYRKFTQRPKEAFTSLFPERGEQAQERKYAISPLIFFWLEDIQHDYLLSHKVTSFN